MSLRLSPDLAAWGLVAALLGGCATTAPQYYSLQAAPAVAAQPPDALSSDFVISVQPVLIPEQLARPQIVIASPESAEVIPLNAALWAGPLEAQIRDALAGSLSRRLNVVDLGLSKVVELPAWRIYVDVQRFDSVYGKAVLQDVVWRLVPQNMPAETDRRVCSARVQLPVGEGMSALVDGHRRSLDLVAGLMAGTLSAAPGGGAAGAAESSAESVLFRGCVRQNAASPRVTSD